MIVLSFRAGAKVRQEGDKIMAEKTQKEQITEHGYSEPEKYTVGSIEELLDKMENQEDKK